MSTTSTSKTEAMVSPVVSPVAPVAPLNKAKAKKAQKDKTFLDMLTDERARVSKALKSENDKVAKIETMVEKLGPGVHSSLVANILEMSHFDSISAKAKTLQGNVDSLATIGEKDFACVSIDGQTGKVSTCEVKLDNAKTKLEKLKNQATKQGFTDIFPSAEFLALKSKQQRIVALVYSKEKLPLSGFTSTSGKFDDKGFFTLVK